MLRLASDADVHGDLIRGLRLREPNLDLVRSEDVLPEGTPDPQVLSWAAGENRVLISHDRNTMTGFAFERVAADLHCPGVIIATLTQSIGDTIDDILFTAEVLSEEEMRNRILVFLPVRE